MCVLAGGAIFAAAAGAQVAALVDLNRPVGCSLSCATFATAVAGDGALVVGGAGPPSDDGPGWAVKWIPSGTAELTGPSGGIVTAYGVSRGGHYIAGTQTTGFMPPLAPQSVAAWRAGPDGIQWLGELAGTCPGRGPGWPAQTSCTSARGISADGEVVVGVSRGQAFRWSATSGIGPLGMLPGQLYSRALGTSADGSIVVGASAASAYTQWTEQAFRWTAASGMQSLGVYGWASAVSSDGGTIVGAMRRPVGGAAPTPDDFQAMQAFRWTSSTGIVPLAQTGGAATQTAATAVSGDGTVIVGYDLLQNKAFRWTAASGLRRLDELLVGYGVDLAGWNLANATAVSEDGRVIAGTGTQPGSPVGTAWLARVPLYPGETGGVAPIDALLASVANMSAVTLSGERLLRLDHSRILDVARHYRGDPSGPVQTASIGNGVPVDLAPRPWSLYALATGQAWNLDPQTQGTSPSGSIGVLYDGVAGWRIGAGVSVASAREDVAFGGHYRTRAAGGHAFAGWAPRETGWRAYALANYLRIDADIDRGYVNGNGTAISSGSTQGSAYGTLIRGAYALAIASRTALIPYVDYIWTSSRLQGYAEDRGGGPFPATFDDQRYSSQLARGGIELSHDTEARRVWTWLAFAKRTRGTGASVSGQYLGIGGFAFQDLRVPDEDWWEAGLGGSTALTAHVRLIGTVGLVAAGSFDRQSSVQGSIGVAIEL